MKAKYFFFRFAGEYNLSSGKRIQEKREKKRKKKGEGKRGEKGKEKRERKRGKEGKKSEKRSKGKKNYIKRRKNIIILLITSLGKEI